MEVKCGNIVYHNVDCPWKENACDESFEYLPTNVSIMRKQFLENLKTWITTTGPSITVSNTIQTPHQSDDSNNFYNLPKMEPKIKQIILEWLSSKSDFENDEELKVFLQFSNAVDVMCIAALGWFLKPTTHTCNSSLFAQCQYCNHCIPLQSYEVIKFESYFPIEDKENVQCNVGNEDDFDVTSRSPLLTHDANSLAQCLSKLGLHLELTNRFHNLNVYPTASLQQTAQFASNMALQQTFANNNNSNSWKQQSSFFGISNRNDLCYSWPRNSLLLQNANVDDDKSINDNNSNNNITNTTIDKQIFNRTSMQQNKKKKKRPRIFF